MVLPPLHATANAESWLRAWHLDPILAPLLTAAGVGYLIAYQTVQRSGRRPPPIWRATAYFAGLAALAVALLGPPDHFNGVLFWVHMVQHLLLMLVAAPLLVLGRPVSLFLLALPPGPRRRVLRAALGFHPARRAISLALHPLSVFLLYNGSFVLWHLPSLYQAAVASPLVHELEHASFFVTALLFWQALLDPLPWRRRLSTEAAVLLLFATWMVSDLLCATVTLSGELLYPIYATQPKPWGLSSLGDQRLGGAMMWAAGGVLYIALLLGRLAYPALRRAGMPRQYARQHSSGRHIL
jgi:cytochrome c oxidase assembly factor CtaG